MAKMYFIGILIFFSNYIFSQNPFSDGIKSDCEKMNIAMKNSDFETILNYTYPKIIEMSGGRETITVSIEAVFDKMKKDGYLFEDMIVGEPEKIYKAGTELHCIIPKQIMMKTPRGRIKSANYLLAISKNNGQTWYFMESKLLDNENKKIIFPSFNNDLEIPKSSEPVLIN
jgi:hypothetical protein